MSSALYLVVVDEASTIFLEIEEPSSPSRHPGKGTSISLSILPSECSLSAIGKMEALAVVGVVSSIVQLVDFSSKILSTGIELYKSADGALADDMTVEQVTKDLIALDKSLNESIRATAASSCLTDETALKGLGEKCKEVSAELLGRLESLKISEKHKAWSTARQTLRGMWGKAKMDAMVQTLDMIKQQLNLRLLVSLR